MQTRGGPEMNGKTHRLFSLFLPPYLYVPLVNDVAD